MPFYEYQCNACEHRLEVLQKISDEPLCYCPECGEASLKKLISRSAFRLKGDGWYETDFKNSGAKDASDKKSGAKDGNDKKVSGTDTKDADKSATGKTASADKDKASKKSSSSAASSNQNA